MAIVEFLGPISKEPLEVDIANLSELKDILSKQSDLGEWLDGVAIAVNDKIVSDLNVPLLKDDKITLLPPVCGG